MTLILATFSMILCILLSVVTSVTLMKRRCSRFEAYEELTMNYPEVWKKLGSPDMRYLKPYKSRFRALWNLEATKLIVLGKYGHMDSQKLMRYFRHERLCLIQIFLFFISIVFVLLSFIESGIYALF